MDTGLSPSFRLQLIQASPDEWSVRGHLYKHTTQRMSLTIGLNESIKKITIFHCIVNNFTNHAPLL